MKNNNCNFLRNLNHKEVSNSATEIKTIIETETNPSAVKSVFTSVDLWNIHKKSKTSFTRRRTSSLYM